MANTRSPMSSEAGEEHHGSTVVTVGVVLEHVSLGEVRIVSDQASLASRRGRSSQPGSLRLSY